MGGRSMAENDMKRVGVLCRVRPEEGVKWWREGCLWEHRDMMGRGQEMLCYVSR